MFVRWQWDRLVLGTIVLVGLTPSSVWAQLPAYDQPRDPFVEGVNRHQKFFVRVAVNHADHIYRGGENLEVIVRSTEAGYLYVLQRGASGRIYLTFPNKYQRDNDIPANREVRVPAGDANFRIRIGPPYGKEVVKAIVCKSKVSVFEDTMPRKGTAAEVSKSLFEKDPELVGPAPWEPTRAESWAEHTVTIETVNPDVPFPPKSKQRFGLFVGIKDFADPRIPNLRVAHADAQEMCKLMKSTCQLDDTILLLNSQATLSSLQKAICTDLPRMSKPGDEVFIYWSGHGGRCADDGGDEKDGYDEFLVPYDGQVAKPQETMLTDDTFGRWVQQLDGRKVVVILDACHSGGQPESEKGISGSKGLDAGRTRDETVQRLFEKGIASNDSLDFLDQELSGIKDIGQGAAVLASSLAAQISVERREGDLSVMTYFLIELMKGSSGKLLLKKAHEYLAAKVPEYVRQKFPGREQTPFLVDSTNATIYLKP